ncbi:unnamed protein product [Didymodactylos carnosus]|uniref:Adenylate kinase isoenzyme 6 homolog n=1 Tax=Didymodactylos carnosus TaxID=1234261 RepID=A0A813W9R0_9BILA|nr:unnamed protein product [Didymodactylos carnosus]CAF1148658.1 unnamed protein product [Didymodactylos carnosus]CAF3642158.1 unnamed protein product [Didymodactylos carnosus]CAF3952707.1 unnamed protein product [Didymodactylos carnosus]
MDRPNIIICGTPGVGKSRLCQDLCQKCPELRYININDIAQEKSLYIEYDDDNECQVLDDERVQDFLEEKYFRLKESGLVIDYHSAEIIPDDGQIQGIFVLRTDNDVLYYRLQQRNYSTKKIDQNIQSEIFQVCLDEANESFDQNIVHELRNNDEKDYQRNLEYLINWIQNWPSINTNDKPPQVSQSNGDESSDTAMKKSPNLSNAKRQKTS